jgi:antitoxin ParD1/3/4
VIGSSETAKLAALKEAARIGFNDIDENRFQDVEESVLESFISDLGRQASERAMTSSSSSQRQAPS